MSSRIVRLGFVAACVWLAASCGASRGADAGRSPAEQAFVDRANAICADGNAELERLSHTVDASSTRAELYAYFSAFVGTIRGQIDAIEALDAPASIAPEVQEFTRTARAALEEVDRLGPARPSRGEEHFAETNQMAFALGLDVCGES